MLRLLLLSLALLATAPFVPAFALAPDRAAPYVFEGPHGQSLVDEVYRRLRSLPSKQAKVRELGLSDGLPVLLVHLPSSRADAPRAFVAAGVHGSEPGGVTTALTLLDYALTHPEFRAEIDLTIVPMVNPGGLARDWRHNLKDLDVNRSFREGAFTESSALLRDALRGQAFDVAVDLHGAQFKSQFFLISANKDAAVAAGALLNFVPQHLLLPSTSGTYPGHAPGLRDPRRYLLYAPGTAVSTNEGTLKDFLASLGVPRSYTLEYPGALPWGFQQVWNFAILKSILSSAKKRMGLLP